MAHEKDITETRDRIMAATGKEHTPHIVEPDERPSEHDAAHGIVVAIAAGLVMWIIVAAVILIAR